MGLINEPSGQARATGLPGTLVRVVGPVGDGIRARVPSLDCRGSEVGTKLDSTIGIVHLLQQLEVARIFLTLSYRQACA